MYERKVVEQGSFSKRKLTKRAFVLALVLIQ